MCNMLKLGICCMLDLRLGCVWRSNLGMISHIRNLTDFAWKRQCSVQRNYKNIALKADMPTALYRFSSDDPDSDDQDINKDYSNFFSKKKINRRMYVTQLHELLRCSKTTAACITKNTPGLLLVPYDKLPVVVKNLSDVGLKKEVIVHYPWLLTVDHSTLILRFQLLQQMEVDDVNDAVKLLEIPLDRLQLICFLTKKENSVIPEGSRIRYLSKALKCPQSDVFEAVANHSFVLVIPFERVKEMLKLLLDFGISPNDILKDVWIFRYNTSVVQGRLKMVHDAGVSHIKPWVLRCAKDVFIKTLQRKVEIRNALGAHASVLEYLSQRLECSLETVYLLSHKCPPLLKVNVIKLKEVLDYLFEEGFTPQQVIHVPRILCHSLETIQERLNHLRDLQHNPTSLMVLCKSKRQFSDYLNKVTL